LRLTATATIAATPSIWNCLVLLWPWDETVPVRGIVAVAVAVAVNVT
jgi:hypothetical protein